MKDAILNLLISTKTLQKLGNKNHGFIASFLIKSSKNKLYQTCTDIRTASWNFSFAASKLYALVLTGPSSGHLCTSMAESKVTSRYHLWPLQYKVPRSHHFTDRHMNVIQKPSSLSQQLLWDLYDRAFTFNCRSLVGNHYAILPKGTSSFRL